MRACKRAGQTSPLISVFVLQIYGKLYYSMRRIKSRGLLLGNFNAAGDRMVAWIADPVDLGLGSSAHAGWLAGMVGRRYVSLADAGD